MASVIVSDRSLQNIANAIRNKNGTTNTYKPSQMANAINALQIGGSFSGTPTAGDTPVLINYDAIVMDRYKEVMPTGLTITIPFSGTYRFKYIARNSHSGSTSWGYISATQLYKNGEPVGSLSEINETMTISQDIECAAGDVIEIYASSSNATYKTLVGCLSACINWDNGFALIT